MLRGHKGNTAKVMANAKKIARRYRAGDKIKELVLDYHTQAKTIKQAILTQISIAEYQRLVSLHNSKSRKGRHWTCARRKRVSPGFSPQVEQLRDYYERIDQILAEAVERENYEIPEGYSKTRRAGGYVNALDADRMLAEAESAKTPQDAPG